MHMDEKVTESYCCAAFVEENLFALLHIHKFKLSSILLKKYLGFLCIYSHMVHLLLLHLLLRKQRKMQSQKTKLNLNSILTSSLLSLHSLPSTFVTYCRYHTKASCMKSNNTSHPCSLWEGQEVFRYIETQKEKEQRPDTHNRAHCRGARIAYSMCVCVSVCVCVCRYVHAMRASLGESVYACACMHTAALFLNVCVHAHMYPHVTMTASYIALVKEIGSGSAWECRC